MKGFAGLETKKQVRWKNQDNVPCYARLGVEGLKTRAVKCGLTETQDLAAIRDFLGDPFFCGRSLPILEIGAGYGRVADWLLEHSPDSSVTLLELSKPSVEHLRDKYRFENRVNVLEGSILSTALPSGSHLALWLWAGFVEFPIEEKGLALRRIAESLAANGILALEVPRSVGSEVNTYSDGQLTLDLCGTLWRGYVPTHTEIAEQSKSAGLFTIGEIYYRTGIGLERTIYFFQKPGKGAK